MDAKPNVQECVYVQFEHTLMLSWKEKPSLKKPCLMLSLGIRTGMVDHELRVGQKRKPEGVLEYNQHMGRVDLLDQKVDYNAGKRVFNKYWKKYLFALNPVPRLQCGSPLEVLQSLGSFNEEMTILCFFLSFPFSRNTLLLFWLSS